MFWDIQFILVPRHSRILAYHAVSPRTFILGVLLILLLVVSQETSPELLLVGNPRDLIDIRVGQSCFRVRKNFYLICTSLSIIFWLQGVQEVTPLFVGQRAIVVVLILHLILHGWWEAVLSLNTNITLRELFFTEGPICLVILKPNFFGGGGRNFARSWISRTC